LALELENIQTIEAVENIQKVGTNEQNKMSETKLIQNKEYKEPIKEILAATSLAYLISPFRSKRLLIKIIWSLFIFVFLFLSIYYVILNISDYIKYETTTSIETIYEQEPKFPTVSICNRFDPNFEFNFTLFYFNNRNLANDWENHIESYNDAYYGKCFRFNSGLNWTNQPIEIKTSKRIGSDEGLWLIFFSNTSFDFGELKVYIHNHTENPMNIYRKGQLISSGSNNYFLVKRILDQKLESPFNECFKDINKVSSNKTIIDYFNRTNRKYNQIECFNLCFNIEYNQTKPCNCSLRSLDEEPYKRCKDNDSCYEKFSINFNQNEKCSHSCPLECDQLSYEVFFTSNKIISATAGGQINAFNDDFLNTEMLKFNTYENVSKNYYSINVYYEELKYTLISQQPKTELFALISNLGGILGLFIGFSFISMLEIVETLAELIYIYFE